MSHLYNASISDLVDFAKAYAKLGWSVQEQLHDLLRDPEADVNPNAVEAMKQLRGRNRELDEMLSAYDERRENEVDED